MKLSMDDLMRYAPSRDIPVEPLSSDETERIRVMTMKKIQKPGKTGRKPLRVALTAASSAARPLQPMSLTGLAYSRSLGRTPPRRNPTRYTMIPPWEHR